MLGLLLVYGLIAGIGFAALGIMSGVVFGFGAAAAPGAATQVTTAMLVGGALGSLLMLAINPLMYCILVVAYYDLRVRKEAFDLDLLATTLEHSALPR